MEVCISFLHGFKEIVINKCRSVFTIYTCIHIYIYKYLVIIVMEQWLRKSSKRSNSLGCSLPFTQDFRICLMKGSDEFIPQIC